MRRAKIGDRAAFDALYQLFLTPVYRFILLRVSDKRTAEDITQVVFLKVYESLERYEERGVSPLAYCLTIARHAVIDHWRRERHVEQVAWDEHPLAETLADDSPSPLQEAQRGETQTHIRAALATLKPAERDALVFRFIDGRSTREIAELLGKTPEAVRQLYVRGLRSLRQAVSKYGYE